MLRIDNESEKVASIVSCLQRHDVDGAKEILKNEPLILRSCPEQVTDSEELVLVAMSRHLQAGVYASHRIKRNLDFFLLAFNSHFSRPPISFSSARDILFMLEFASGYFHYLHEVEAVSVCAKFELNSECFDVEANAARHLVSMARREDWVSGSKEEAIRRLRSAAPGFALYSYEYAFRWGYGNRSMRQSAKYR